jgi:hypothetical protein
LHLGDCCKTFIIRAREFTGLKVENVDCAGWEGETCEMRGVRGKGQGRGYCFGLS